MNSRTSRSLADYWRAARRRKLALILPAAVLAISTGVALKRMPDLYQSRAHIALGTRASAPSDVANSSALVQQVTSHEALEAVADKCKLTADQQLEVVISGLRGGIDIEPDPSSREPNGFTVSYVASDPVIARTVTDELVSRLIFQYSGDSTALTAEAVALREKAAEIDTQLRELEEKDPRLLNAHTDPSFAASQSSRNIQPSSEALRAQQMNIESLKDQQYKFQQQLADVERRIVTQRQIVDQQKHGSPLREDPTFGVLVAKRAELEGQRDTLINRQELTEKHPKVLAINDQIAAINRQIEELRQQDGAMVGQTPEARELVSLEAERNRVKIDLEVTSRELARRSAITVAQVGFQEQPASRREVPRSRLTPDYLDLKQTQKEIAGSLENVEARIKSSEASGSKQSRVVEPANLPDRSVSPNRPLLTILAAVVGLAFGTGFALFAESARLNSLQDGDDIEHYTKIPLLAAIPHSPTAGERRQAALFASAKLVFATVISIIATFALTKMFIAVNIFSLITRK